MQIDFNNEPESVGSGVVSVFHTQSAVRRNRIVATAEFMLCAICMCSNVSRMVDERPARSPRNLAVQPPQEL
jgi:hypothetical protein